MKKTLTIVLSIVIALGVVLGIPAITIFSHRNVAVTLEESVKAQYTSNKSNYDSMVKSAKEMAQVTDMYAEDFERIYSDLISGRNQDTQLLFKVVKESNPTLDSTLYTTLQREISANRKTFDNNQATLVDKIREYNTYIKKKFIMAAITGRSEINADEYIVTSSETTNAFNTGEADVIDLRGK